MCLVTTCACWMDAADAQAANVQNVMGVLFSSTSFQGMFNLVRRRPFARAQ